MANVEKHTTSKNEYQNRSAFMSDHSKGYGVERHTRVTSLAENGRYISGRKRYPGGVRSRGRQVDGSGGAGRRGDVGESL